MIYTPLYQKSVRPIVLPLTADDFPGRGRPYSYQGSSDKLPVVYRRSARRGC